MLNILRRTSPKARLVRDLYSALNAAARRPVFYREYGVADTIDGRFDLLALHAWLVLSRLETAGHAELSRALSDAIFIGFDEALRDLGNGDMGMGPRMKKLGNAFNGRLLAYEAAAGDEAALAEAILRNIYRGEAGHEAQARGVAGYATFARLELQKFDPAAGHLEFPAVPTTLP
jgi:cytochrome b pre-mRNA-processing protein 3